MNHVIPTDWQKLKIKEIGKVSSGSTPLRSNHEIFFLNGIIPWVKTMDLTNGNINTTKERITEIAAKRCKPLPIDSVLVAMYGGFNQIGRTGILSLEAAINQAISAIIVDPDKITPRYLIKYLNGRRYLWKRFAASSRKDPNITRKDVCDFPITLPPLAEQHLIVAVLESWDKALEALSQKIELKKNINKGLMQELLTGKRRLKGYSDEWVQVKLRDVFEVKKGAGLSKGKLDQLGDKKCILYGEIYTTYTEVIINVKSRTNEKEGTPSLFGDVLIPASTTTSALDLATATTILEDDVLLGGDINILRPKKHKSVDSKFWAYFLTHAQKKELACLAQGITIVHLYGRDIMKLKVQVPTNKEEQTSIAKILTTANNEITALEKKKQTLEDQKKFLLNNLITGKIRTTANLTVPKS